MGSADDWRTWHAAPVQQRGGLPCCIMPATPKRIHLHAGSCNLQRQCLAAQAVAAVNEQLAAGAFRLPGKKVATTIEPACDYYIAEASGHRACIALVCTACASTVLQPLL